MPKESSSPESESSRSFGLPPEPDLTAVQNCYDFPEFVIHRGDLSCGRYQENGVCRPLPTPVEPYNDEEKLVVKGVEWFRNTLFNIANGDLSRLNDLVPTDHLGTTLYPTSQTDKEQ